MKKILVLAAMLLFITGCGQKPTERLETAMEELTNVDSIFLVYKVEGSSGSYFKLDKYIDIANENIKMIRRHGDDGVVEFEQVLYYEKDGNGYNYYLQDNDEWFLFREERLSAFFENIFSFESNFENVFTFLRGVEKDQIEVVSSDEYIIKTEDETLLDNFFPNEGDEIKPLEVRVLFDGDSIDKIMLEFNDGFETLTYTWSVASINDYTFELPSEVRESAKEFIYENGGA